MPTLIHWVSFFAGGGAAAPYVNPTSYDDWLHPVADTTGSFSTDTDPDEGPEPSTLTLATGPTPID